MAWLVRDAKVLASVEIADTFRTRLFGLLGRRSLDGALLIRPARSVHTVGMRFPIDGAFCDGELRVLAVRGAFERWGLAVGDELAVHGEAGHGGPGGGDHGRGEGDRGDGLSGRPARLAAAARRIGRGERVRRRSRQVTPVDRHIERIDPVERPERMERPVLT